MRNAEGGRPRYLAFHAVLISKNSWVAFKLEAPVLDGHTCPLEGRSRQDTEASRSMVPGSKLLPVSPDGRKIAKLYDMASRAVGVER